MLACSRYENNTSLVGIHGVFGTNGRTADGIGGGRSTGTGAQTNEPWPLPTGERGMILIILLGLQVIIDAGIR